MARARTLLALREKQHLSTAHRAHSSAQSQVDLLVGFYRLLHLQAQTLKLRRLTQADRAEYKDSPRHWRAGA